MAGDAHLARYAHDFRVVRRLIEAVPAGQLDAAGALLLGEALCELGGFDASERVLARGAVRARPGAARSVHHRPDPARSQVRRETHRDRAGLPRLDKLLTRTRALGARHRGYGARAADYQTAGAALLAALAAILGSSFDAPPRHAWTLAYNLIAETMPDGAAAARPAGS